MTPLQKSFDDLEECQRAWQEWANEDRQQAALGLAVEKSLWLTIKAKINIIREYLK